jgi:hypothetical protein
MLVGFVRFLCWFFFIAYLIKVLARLLAPILMKRFANKMQDRFNQQYQNQQSPPKEGEVTIERTHDSIKKKSDNIGEYVDFEEVEE